MVHFDVWGLAKTMSLGGCRYFVTFIDDCTRKLWVYFMKEKREVFDHFKRFRAVAEKETGRQIKCLRSDGGGEYFSKEFIDYLLEQGIQRQQTCRYTPQQNGVAERKNRHIAEVARAMMNEKELPHYFWAEAVATAAYIMNRTPTAAVHGVTPEQKFTGRRPDLSHLKVFGCVAYMHVPAEKRSKLDPKAEKCIFIGYSQEQKGYRCYNPLTRILKVSRDVIFDEMSSWYMKTSNTTQSDAEEKISVVEKNAESQSLSGPHEASPSTSSNTNPWQGRLRRNPQHSGSPNKGREKVQQFTAADLSAGASSVVHGQSAVESFDEELGIPSITTQSALKAKQIQGAESPGLHRSERVKYPVERLTYDGYTAIHYAYMVRVIEQKEPECFEDARGHREWEEAMSEEMAALHVSST